MSMLELQGVTKVYGQGATVVNALGGVDLKVERGAMVAVMGPSGSGSPRCSRSPAAWRSPQRAKC